MRSSVRFSFIALLLSAMVAVAAPAAAQAAFGVESFFASNCKVNTCKKVPPAEEKAKAEVEGFTQAGGHPNFGITDFTVNTRTASEGGLAPEGIVTFVRTDVAPGLSTNPEAVPKCSAEQFGTTEVAPGTFTPPTCAPGTILGENKVVVAVQTGPDKFLDLPLSGTVYNLEQSPGLASKFGVALALPEALTGGIPGLFAHTIIEGHVETATDYHDYFEIEVSPTLPLISSRLTFKGNIGEGAEPIGSGGFLTNPTSCTGIGPQTTSTLTLVSKEGGSAVGKYTTPIGNTGCNLLPFAPTFALTPETTQNDQPDGITTNLRLPHDLSPNGIDTSDVRTASVTLPEGMTLSPSAANGLEACKPSQIGIGSKEPVTCPAGSKIGTVNLEVPGLPAGSLAGTVYLGGPETGSITDPPYVMYIDAESTKYGLSVRLKGAASPDLNTGRVTATFADPPGQPPEQPFSNLVLHFTGGNLAPIANPLACGPASTTTLLTPYSGFGAAVPADVFTVDSDGKGKDCPATLPFALGQSTANQTPTAGGRTNFSFNLTRNDGEQYLSQVKTTLPAGLVGAISTVTPCTDVQAESDTCPAASQIGSAAAVSGSGPTPFTFGNGKVFLTGPYKGAPYGLSIVVPAIAGPFDLGFVRTRATLTVDPYTDRVTTTSVIPRVVKGIPTRLRGINVSINKQGFLYNPTNCDAKATNTTLSAFILAGGSETATQDLSSPFQVGNCGALKFKPSFKAASGARTSKANGASLETTVNQIAGDANIKSVLVQLPKALPSRLTTLQKACTEAQFNADPFKCPSGSFVGGARANTPLLPSKLKGPAILVSHGGAAFPDLDLVLEANGVRTILVGNTDIKKGITTTNFAATPDVPVSSITVNLPIGSHSALAANTNLCANPLIMPTTITSQSGVVVKQNTRINVRECGVRIVGHKVVGNTAYLTVQTFGAGRISGKGAGAANAFRKLRAASKRTTLKVPLTRRARGRHRPFKVRLRVGFVPSAKGGKSSASFVTVTFR